MKKAQHVVVIGGGIVGCSVARALAQRGARVTLIEREHPAAAATGASFAWLNNQAYFRNADGVDDQHAQHYFMLHRLALGAWRRVEDEIGDVGIRWHGMLSWCTPGSEEQERFEGELTRRRQWGGPARRVGAEDIQALVPGCIPGPVGTAYYGPDEGNIDPSLAVAALAGACVRLGVDVRWPCTAKRLNVSGNRVTGVGTDDGVITCDDVVVATGVDTPALAAQIDVDVPLVESRGAIVHLGSMPLFLGPVLLAPSVHAVQRPDGRVAIAQHYAGSPVVEGVEVDPQEMLQTAAAALPVLSRARWSGSPSAGGLCPRTDYPSWAGTRNCPTSCVSPPTQGCHWGPCSRTCYLQKSSTAWTSTSFRRIPRPDSPTPAEVRKRPGRRWGLPTGRPRCK